jgi:hypothetical protein
VLRAQASGVRLRSRTALRWLAAICPAVRPGVLARQRGADSENRTRVSGLATRCLTVRPCPLNLVPAAGLEPASFRVRSAAPLHSAPRGHVSFWSGRGDSNSHLQLGRLRPCRWATPAHVSKSWRPWLESNQQDAGLESAPVPPPHGQRLLGGCRESNPDLPVHSRASCQLNEHPRTPTNWSCEPDSNRHPSDTGRPVTL